MIGCEMPCSIKGNLKIYGKEYILDIEVLEDDTVTGNYLPPHGPPTTVRPVAVPTSAVGLPAFDPNVDEAKVCRSPVAGVVIRVSVQPGQELQSNELMMVLEAMKVETNISAPISGKVKKVNIVEGDGVKLNQVLVEFE